MIGFRNAESRARASFAADVVAATGNAAPPACPIVAESDVAALPEPVRRYLRFMGVIGVPRGFSFRAEFTARFRRGPGAWLPCKVLQYDRRDPVSRAFHMRLSLGGVLPVTVRDTYSFGKGRMLAKAFDVFPVVDGAGMEIDTGELVTYLNDALLISPSMILGPETSWSATDSGSFEVALTDVGRTVRACVWVDERGAPTNFSTTDRFYDAPDGRRVRTEWRTPIDGWQAVPGTPRWLPTRAYAVWMLPSGPLTYADFSFEPERFAFDV